MIKVLHYYTQYNLGGTEKVIFSILSGIDKEKFDCFFLAQNPGTDDQKLKEIGVKLNYIDFKKNYKKELYNFFVNNNFDIIHVHNCKEMKLILKIAKRANIPTRIIHSHVSRGDLNKIFWLLKAIKSYSITKYANKFFACSNEAAKWLFPTKIKEKIIIRNGIDIGRFKFDLEKRTKTRKEYNLENLFVLCTVSRIEKTKNIEFLIRLLKLFKNQKIKLLIIGDGSNTENLRKKANKFKVDNKIIFIGKTNDVSKYLSASDLFLFPSKYEGMGISAIEAQYASLKVIASDRIPSITDIGENLIEYLPLNLKVWEKKLEEIIAITITRRRVDNNLFDCHQIIKTVEEEYIKAFDKINITR